MSPPGQVAPPRSRPQSITPSVGTCWPTASKPTDASWPWLISVTPRTNCPGVSDGDAVFVTPDMLRASRNAGQVQAGLAYTELYSTMPLELIGAMRQLVTTCPRRRRGDVAPRAPHPQASSQSLRT